MKRIIRERNSGFDASKYFAIITNASQVEQNHNNNNNNNLLKKESVRYLFSFLFRFLLDKIVSFFLCIYNVSIYIYYILRTFVYHISELNIYT